MYKLLYFFIFLLASFSLTAQELSYDALMEAGEKALKQKKYSEAIKHYHDAIQLKPASKEAYLKQMECAIHRRDITTFKKDIQKLEEMKHPLILEVYLTFVQLAKKRQQYEEAMAMLDNANTRFPNQRQLMLEKVDLYDKMHNTPEKITLLNQLINKNPNDAKAMYLLAKTYYFSNTEKSIELFKKLIVVDQYTDAALTALGKLYMYQYDNSKDKEALENAYRYYQLYSNRHPKDQEVKRLLHEIENLR